MTDPAALIGASTTSNTYIRNEKTYDVKQEQEPHDTDTVAAGSTVPVAVEPSFHADGSGEGPHLPPSTPAPADDPIYTISLPAKELLLSSRQFTDRFIPPDYLIDGLLQRRFLYSLTGATGAG